MYHAACKVEFQPFNQSYSQLTFLIFLNNIGMQHAAVLYCRSIALRCCGLLATDKYVTYQRLRISYWLLLGSMVAILTKYHRPFYQTNTAKAQNWSNRSDRSNVSTEYFMKMLQNVSGEYHRWVVETQFCKLRDTKCCEIFKNHKNAQHLKYIPRSTTN